MNEIIPFNIDDFTPEQIQYLQNKLMVRQADFIQKRVEYLEEAIKAQRTDIEVVKADQQKTIEVAANSLRVQQGRYEFINQGDFGRFFTVSISSVDVGKLLKVVGLAMPSKGPTTPFREFMGKYAQVTANAKYSVTQWHYERCMERIDKWLKENGFYEKFYSVQSEKEMKVLIEEIYAYQFHD